MKSFRIIITPRAGSDLESIHDYIAQDSPQAAQSVVTRILDALEHLRQFPHRAAVERQRPRLRHPVRSLVVSPYIVYFRAIDADETVRILHVRHGARRQPRRFDR
ncbi:MAG TPA: type II toxin-antitoxin system RelE/ParE family toxin [Phycisphaerae bacterium]|nr:type II toxin-antitoxin system RelE/ParE family toxin [Phycisphaerae bacterium]